MGLPVVHLTVHFVVNLKGHREMHFSMSKAKVVLDRNLRQSLEEKLRDIQILKVASSRSRIVALLKLIDTCMEDQQCRSDLLKVLRRAAHLLVDREETVKTIEEKVGIERKVEAEMEESAESNEGVKCPEGYMYHPKFGCLRVINSEEELKRWLFEE